ncbi:Chondroitin sulfate synthase 2 [Halotydeus destructor]|nr:Chondroitin sulfate synthase 2 [Halotydeus destructor]
MSDNTYVNIHHLKQSILLMEISHPVLIIADNQKCNDINQAVSPALLFNSKFLDKCSDNITCWRVSCQETELSYSLYALNYDINGELAIDAREFSSALVTYPIYTTKLNLKLHQLASQNDLLNGLAKLHETEAELYKLVTDSSKFERNILQSTWPLGIPRPYKPTNRFSVIRWTEVNVQQKTSYLADDNQQIKILDEDDEEDIYRTISLIKLYCLKQNLINCDLMKIENFYKRFEAMRGLEYIVDIQIGENLNKRFEVLHPLNGIELVKGVPFVTELTSVLIVLPVRESDIISASSFMTHYAHTFLKRPNHSTKLVVLTLSTQALSNSTEHDAFSSLKITVNMLARRYAATANISVISVQSSLGHISQLAYLDLTVGQVMANDTLILHVQPAAQISFDFLNRVRMNTISGRQVFFPVPFVEYQIASENEESREMPLLVATSKGYFDDRTFNYFSFYSHDYLKIRQEYGPNFVSHEAEIIAEHIVSSSAWDAAKLFVESVQSRINILRITEPGLTERFFKKSSNCQSSESGTKAIAACLHRMQHSIGLKSQLAKSISDQA